MFWFLLIAVAACLLLYWKFWRWTHRRMLELAAVIPGPPALPFIGNALIFMSERKFLDIITDNCNIYGEYFKVWLGPELWVSVGNPTDIRALLTNNNMNQKGPTYDVLVPLIGPGILTGGPCWRNHRKIANPIYNKKAVTQYMSIFNAEAEELAKVLSRKAPGVKFDVYKDVVQFTTQSVNQTLLGFSKEDSQRISKLDEVVGTTRGMYDFIFDKMTKWWLQIPPIFWLTGSFKQQRNIIKLIDEFCTDILNKRKKSVAEKNIDEQTGVVDRYILSGELSEKEIKFETMSLFTTSQEAAAKIASAVLKFLAHLPDWQDKVYNEIMEVIGPDDAVTSEHLKELKYLDMVYKEALRYLPIAAVIQRTVREEISINEGKYIIPPGTTLNILLHQLHRNPRYWEHPDKVMPERFMPENMDGRDPNAFVPFSLGPMDCLGRVFATAIIKTIVVWVLRHNHLEPSGSLDDIELHYAISVSIAGGYNIATRPRNIKK